MDKFKVYENSQYSVFAAPFGEYQTNCYVLHSKAAEDSIIIDPGIGASSWAYELATENGREVSAILNTHGHFDHIWSNAELKEKLPKTPLIAPLLDAFMLERDCFCLGLPLSFADKFAPDSIESFGDFKDFAEFKKSAKTANSENIGRESEFVLGSFSLKFIEFPGHTPGCSVIMVGKEPDCAIFSGDFIFKRSIGRSDFPYSSNAAMRESLEYFAKMQTKIQNDIDIFPGHGDKTSLKEEQKNSEYWCARLL